MRLPFPDPDEQDLFLVLPYPQWRHGSCIRMVINKKSAINCKIMRFGCDIVTSLTQISWTHSHVDERDYWLPKHPAPFFDDQICAFSGIFFLVFLRDINGGFWRKCTDDELHEVWLEMSRNIKRGSYGRLGKHIFYYELWLIPYIVGILFQPF